VRGWRAGGLEARDGALLYGSTRKNFADSASELPGLSSFAATCPSWRPEDSGPSFGVRYSVLLRPTSSRSNFPCRSGIRGSCWPQSRGTSFAALAG
jgi:hypothetical protein